MAGFHESGGDSAQHERDGHGHCHLGSENDSHGQLQRHDKRFNDVISVVHTSNSALAYVKISSLIGCDTTPDCYTATSITIMWKVGCIKILLPRALPNPLSTITEVQHEPWLVGEHNMRPLASVPPLILPSPVPSCPAMTSRQWQHNVRPTGLKTSIVQPVSHCLSRDLHPCNLVKSALKLCGILVSVSQGWCDLQAILLSGCCTRANSVNISDISCLLMTIP